MKNIILSFLSSLLLALLLSSNPILVSASEGTKSGLSPMQLRLASPISNNAVALAEINGVKHLFSFAGIEPNKTYQTVSAKAFSVNLVNGESKLISGLPDNRGRLASIAATVDNQIYLFGGYTVAADHSEVSTAEVYRYNPATDQYLQVSVMPTPVDDSVALVYLNRYIYLISGWHNSDNVDLVQVYDTKNNQWFSATRYPGNPVFGHAAGIVDNQLIVADGVKVVARVKGKNQYAASQQNWFGEIDANDPSKINWKSITKHPNLSLYRMAAVGVPDKNIVLFAGGSDNPYNFNGIGYDGNPSQPSKKVFGYNLVTSQWLEFKSLDYPSMDHRGLLLDDNQFYIVGGMLESQLVTDKIQAFKLSKIKEK